jgi:outer membrane receptor for Fe3+-dicitrate
MVQAYSALPFNITSGLTTVQGTAARPIVDGAFIARNAGIGPDYFNSNVRVSRTFRFGARTRVQALVEAFNLTDRTNVVTVNGSFGAGAYPANPSATFGRPTAVGEPRTLQFGARVSW